MSTVEARRERTRQAATLTRLFSGKAPRRRRIPRQVYPKAIEAEYARALIDLIIQAARRAFDPLRAELPGLLEAARRERKDAGEGARIRQLIEQAAERMRQEVSPTAVEQLAQQFAQRTATHQRIQLGRQVRAALGADVFINDRKLVGLIDGFVQHNVSLIKRIPERLHNEVEAMAMRAVTSGQLVDDLTEDIEKRFGIAERHARLIARDQIGKLNGDINETRQRELGVTRFIWRTVGDERVRDEHDDLDGETFSWDELPEVDGEEISPGSAIQCRCFSEPVLDDIFQE